MEGALVQDAADSRPPAVALAQTFAELPRRHLVVLGEPGAGKTTLALLFTLATIDAARPDDPVPVLLSVAGWDPAEPIEEWVVRRLTEDYPHLAAGHGEEELRRLVEDRRVVLVLDGLDEMPRQLLGAALQDLDRAGSRGVPMLMTCRSAEFEAAVSDVGALSLAAVVEIEPVRADDAAVYLVQREVTGQDRWAPVLQTMTRHPDGPLASALSTPLMISLARRVYRAPRTKPGELADLATADAIERHLLGRFLPTVYPSGRAAARAERWLAFLAHHLRDRVQDPNLQWWHLAAAVPRRLLGTLVAGTVTSLGALVGLLIGAVMLFSGDIPAGDLLGAVIAGAGVGCCLGVFAGLYAGRTADQRGRAERGVVSGVLRDLRVIVATLCLIPAVAALVLLATYMAERATAVELVVRLRLQADDVVRAARADVLTATVVIVMVAVVVTGVAAVVNALGVGRAGVPRRSVPRAGDALPSLAAGLRIGLLLGFPVGGCTWLLEGDLTDAVLVSLMVAAVTGIPVGVGRWLGTPAEEGAASSPASVLRGDRAALLIAAGGTGAVTAAAAFVIFFIEARDVSTSFLGGGIFGSGAAVVVLFGSGAPWPIYTVARLWLALRGRLPWRLSRFLRHAHAAGVLRQAGPAYQIRHDLLRTYLADQWRPTDRWRIRKAAVDLSGTRPKRRRWRAVAWPTIALALLPAVVMLVEPDTQPRNTLGPDVAHSRRLSVLALAAHPNQPAVLAVICTGRRPCTMTGWRGPRFEHVVQAPVPGSWRDGSLSVHGTLILRSSEHLLLQDMDGRKVPLPDSDSDPEGARGGYCRSMYVCASFSADGRSVVVADRSSMRLYDASGRGRPVTVAHGVGPAASAAVSSDRMKVAVRRWNGGVVLWGGRTPWPKVLNEQEPASGAYFARNPPVFSADSTVLAANDRHTIRTWTAETGEPRTTMTIRSTIEGLAITPKGDTIAAYDDHGVARLWDARTGRQTAVLPHRAGRVTAVAFTADGSMLVTAGKNRGVSLWDVAELVTTQS